VLREGKGAALRLLGREKTQLIAAIFQWLGQRSHVISMPQKLGFD
jgi:hypothetical protein